MNKYCPQPQAHPDRCGCQPDAFQIARHSKLLVEQQREQITALEAECARLKNSLLAITARHFAESWKKRTSDAELEQYLSAGIAQLEAERDKLTGLLLGLKVSVRDRAAGRAILADDVYELIDAALSELTP